MAKEIPGFAYTAEAAADLSTKQYYAVKLDSSGEAAVVAAAGVDFDGVLQNDPSARYQAASIVKSGITKVVVGTGGSTKGLRATLASDGTFVLATTELSVGVFMDTVSAAEVGTVLLDDGPTRRSRVRRAGTVATLTGTLTMTTASTFYQKLDPGGASRDVTLPAVADSTNLDFLFLNAADAAENLVVKNVGGSTIGTVNQNEAGLFVCDGSVWVLGAIWTIALS